MFRFCRSKCHKSFKAKRNPRRVRWTKAYRKSHGKELTVDPVLEFEKSKDTTVRYNRDTWVDTVQAMEKISKIKEDRETRFWEERMVNAKHDKAEIIKKDLIRNQTLIGDEKMREKVEQLRERREQKKLERLAKKKNKAEKTKNLNLGLNDDIEMNDGEIETKNKQQQKSVKKAKKTYRKKVKKMIIDRRNNKNKIIEELDEE